MKTKIIVLILFICLLLVPTVSTAWWDPSWIYNNLASNSVSNINTTFIFGDDFSSDLTKLVVTGTAVISEDKLKVSGNNAWNTNGVISTPTLIVITPEPIYPNPLYIPTLKPYEIDKSHDIWHAKDPSSYITPDNEWIQYYAKNDLSVGIIYRTDDDMYNYPPNGDMWQNADYTLYTGYGDCEDIAIAEVSIFKAKGKEAIVVGGYVTLDNGQRIRDFWTEVYNNEIKSILSSNPVIQTQRELRFEPLYMFNDKITWRDYNANWYK